MALGALVVSLGLDASEFITGMSRSEQQAKRFGQNLDRSIAAGIIKAEIALQAFTRGVGLAVDAFKDLTTGAANFKDLEETTGAAAESIASLAVSAATAGVDINDVASATQKLTKNLVGVDDEGKAAGAALKALNINVSDFKKLDPVGQYEAIGRALSGYADGAEKVAVAQALFGKSGAEQLKVFKALEEAGGRQTILTQRQIELADAYADAQAKSRAQLRLYAQAAASEALPALTDLTTAAASVARELLGVDAAGGKLSANNGAKAFAEGLADGLAFVADAGVAAIRVLNAIAGSVKSVGADIVFLGRAAQFAAAPTSDNFQGVKEAFETRQKIAAEANQRYLDLLEKDAARFRNALGDARTTRINTALGQDPRELARRGRAQAELPRLRFDGSEKAAKAAKDATSEADRYIQSLERQLSGLYDLTAAEQVLADIRSGKAGRIGVVQQEMLKGIADEIDATKEAIRVSRERADARNRDNDAAEQAARENERLDRERLKALTANTSSEVFKQQQRDIEFLRQAYYDAKISAEDYGEAVAIVMAKSAKDTQAVKSVADELGFTFASSFEDAIVEGKKFGDVLKSLEKDIVRILIRKSVIEPLAGAATDFLKGSGIGSLFGGGKAIGGPTMPNSAYPFLERGPEVYSDGSRSWLFTPPGARGMVDPQPKFAKSSSQTNYINITVPGTTDKRTAEQVGAEVSRRLAIAGARNN